MSAPYDIAAKAVPTHLQCHEHGTWHRVEREAVLEHADGSGHRYALAVCRDRKPHEIADYIGRARQP